MLKTKLLHPEILKALGSNGHGAKILIADGNFPISTCTPLLCKRVFLNFSPDVLSVKEVLRVLKDYISIESGIVVMPEDESEQSVHNEFQKILGEGIFLKRQKRFEFYREVKSQDTCLAISTGETRLFANILLTIGSIKLSER
ncbi:MAG: RbsD/FucU family protein [Ginsengibacter sp.]